jgi:hypothetical protein
MKLRIIALFWIKNSKVGDEYLRETLFSQIDPKNTSFPIGIILHANFTQK